MIASCSISAVTRLRSSACRWADDRDRCRNLIAIVYVCRRVLKEDGGVIGWLDGARDRGMRREGRRKAKVARGSSLFSLRCNPDRRGIRIKTQQIMTRSIRAASSQVQRRDTGGALLSPDGRPSPQGGCSMLAGEMLRCCGVKLSKLRETENQLVVDVVRSASAQSVQGFSNCCDHFLATSQLFGWCCVSSNQVSSHSDRLVRSLQCSSYRIRIL